MTALRLRPTLAVAGAIALGAIVGACGASGGDDSTTTTSTATIATAPPPVLPRRSRGVLVVDTPSSGGLSGAAVVSFNRNAGGSVDLQLRAATDAQAFVDLCTGRVDVIESTRQISRAELLACRRNGVVLTPPIAIASDAIVMATKNESDVGGDCLSVAGVRDIFRRGSTISNWSQVGFSSIPLSTTGPNANSAAFEFFAQTVLLARTDHPTLGLVRADYRPHASDTGTRIDITGAASLARARVRALAREKRDLVRAKKQRAKLVAAAEEAAARKVVRQIERENRERARKKVAVNDPKALERRNAQRVAAAKRVAGARAGVIADQRYARQQAQLNAALLAQVDRPGVIGFVGFTYYGVYEEQLRPMEIDGTPLSGRTGANARPNCIFPSQQTVTTGQYPLSRRIRLYVSTTNLRRAETQAFLRYYLTRAQSLASSNQLVPITDQQRDEAIARVTGTKAPQQRGGAVGESAQPADNQSIPGVSSN